ncbi:MAG TPA: hypothetical protein VHE55_08000 [Fimbriimonadaceae bacterium]|nr:hypothetical protein [Fimbriimonadaceae bacterium]
MKPEFQFKKVVADAVACIESKYGLRVIWRDLPEGVTGDLDGAEIVLDSKNDPETELYVLLHLFGHTAQWNNSAMLRRLGHEQPIHASHEKLASICTYEQNASRIGISLLHEIGHGELQEWISRFFWADWAFLKCLYTTGERPPMEVKWDCPCEVLEPLAVPKFQPHKFEHRQAFE